jgi:hypothetical protein
VEKRLLWVVEFWSFGSKCWLPFSAAHASRSHARRAAGRNAYGRYRVRPYVPRVPRRKR